MKSIKSVLSQTAFWQINKSLAQEVGLEAALLLSDLIDRQSYFERRGMIIDIEGEPFFFVTSDKIEQSTTLTYHKQKKCIKTLENAGMLNTRLKGVPAKIHFNIVENKIWKSLNTSIEETLKLDLEKLENKNSNSSKCINNNRLTIIDNNNINNNIKNKQKVYFVDSDLQILFLEFLELRKSLKAKNTDRAISLILKKLEGLDKFTQQAMLEQSIENSWKSVFPLKNQNKKEPKSLAKEYFPEMFGGKTEVKAIDISKVNWDKLGD